MVRKLRQTFLEASDTGELVLVPPPPLLTYPNLRPSKDCWRSPKALILQLPDELLQQCLQAVADLDLKLSKDFDYANEYYYNKANLGSSADADDCQETDHDSRPLEVKRRICIRYESTHALILTCKRFHKIAVSMLYALPYFAGRYHEQDRSPQCEKFYDTIKRCPSLRLYVKHLALQRKSLGHDFVQIGLRFPNLKKLELVHAVDKDEEGEVGPHPDEEGTVRVNEFRLRQIRARPRDLKYFLKWFAQLHVFALDDVTFDGYEWEYTEPDPEYRWSHAILTDVLSPQRLHLQVLQLGWMGYTYDQNQFNVSLFSSLHTLQLCIAYEKPDALACRNWLTATLRTIVLDTGKNDSQGGKRSNFDTNERKEVVDFARLASEEKKQRPGSVGLTELGFLAHNIGDDAWDGDCEWHCDHEGWDSKTKILKTLKTIEGYGFSAFWIGASGARHTVETLQAARSLCAAET